MCWEDVHTFVHTRKECSQFRFCPSANGQFRPQRYGRFPPPVAFGGFKVARVRSAFASFGSSVSDRGFGDNFVRDVPTISPAGHPLNAVVDTLRVRRRTPTCGPQASVKRRQEFRGVFRGRLRSNRLNVCDHRLFVSHRPQSSVAFFRRLNQRCGIALTVSLSFSKMAR
jgi:hypothetical protein